MSKKQKLSKAKIPPVLEGYQRQWTRCKTCGNIAYYDFIPYSLSNPILCLPCGHGAAERFHSTVTCITADEALRELAG